MDVNDRKSLRIKILKDLFKLCSKQNGNLSNSNVIEKTN